MDSILVIKLGALGDFIQAMGPMQAIRRHHPDALITLLTTRPFAKFGEECGYFNSIWIDERPRWHDLPGWLSLRHRFIEGNFGRIYDLQNNDRTSFYLRLFPKSARPEWVGTAPGASHRNASPSRTAGRAIDGHIETLALAGIKDIAIDDLSWIRGDLSRFKKEFGLADKYVLLVPGSAPQRPEKRWPVSGFSAVATAVVGQGFQPVVIGSKDESELGKSIKETCPETLNLAGKTSLTDIVILARHAQGAVSNDTGPAHMIAPTGCPILVLFSRHSNPQRHAPVGRNVRTLQKDELKDLSPDDVIRTITSSFFYDPAAQQAG